MREITNTAWAPGESARLSVDVFASQTEALKSARLGTPATNAPLDAGLFPRRMALAFGLPRALEMAAADATRRLLDVTVAAIGLVISAPLMLLLATIIRLSSPGPVLFRQQRVGRDGGLFTFYKFRTMYVDAPERFPDLYAYQYSEEQIRTMYFKVLDDPRLTWFGEHLRKTSLDELPNLWNVLRGDMSLVGPRPELPEMLPYYQPHQLEKFTVKPGVTGLAQVTGRAVLRFQETITADLAYCKNRSLWLDWCILARTVKTVLLRVGAF